MAWFAHFWMPATIGEKPGPWVVMSDSGLLLERDDGEPRTFRKQETAARAAHNLNREAAKELLRHDR